MMISRLRKMLEIRGSSVDGKAVELEQSELSFASAAVMLEAARLDGEISEDERAQIAAILVRQFAVDEETAAALLASAERDTEDVHDLYGFTSIIRRHFNHDERVAMVGLLWEVCYADGELHDFEANLLRRLAGLLYVTDRESGIERKRALDRLNVQ